MKIKELPEQFEKETGEMGGYSFTQIERSAFAYIYEKQHKGGRASYEVFKRKVHTQFNTVSYPRSNAFGVWAWDIPTLKDAKNKFDELNAAAEKRLNIKNEPSGS